MKDELDVLLTVLLIQIELAFNQKILDRYKSNLNWKNISYIFEKNDRTNLYFFCKFNRLIYQLDGITTRDHTFQTA